MKEEKLLNAIGNISDDLIDDAVIVASKKTQPITWMRRLAIAACLCFLIAISAVITPLFGGNNPDRPSGNPLVITVYARTADGSLIPTALKVGEKTKLYPATSPYADDFDGYAFDLTLLGAKYVSPCAVDENWEPKLYPGDSSQYDFHWSFTEGDDIIVVWPDQNGKIILSDDLMQPKPHGSAILWRPNDDGLSRSTIGVYNAEFELLATYYLEISEADGSYYAEIVKIEQE